MACMQTEGQNRADLIRLLFQADLSLHYLPKNLGSLLYFHLFFFFFFFVLWFYAVATVFQSYNGGQLTLDFSMRPDWGSNQQTLDSQSDLLPTALGGPAHFHF